MKLKVYIAGSLAVKERVKHLAGALERAGFEVTSQWIDIHTGYDRDPEALQKAAEGDVKDLVSADALIHAYTGVRSTGGGADAELGMALALGKSVLLLGERTNIFHNLPQVGSFQTVEELVNALKNIESVLT